MSTVKVSANVSGSGIFTIESPNSNTDRTLTLPDATDTLVGKATSDTLTNKTLTSASLTSPTISNNFTFGTALAETPSGSAPLAFCRAWVNFNGQGTVAIRGSYNVTSITDDGTGVYTVNFTTAMPDINYAVVGGSGNNLSFSFITPNAGTKNTTSTKIFTTASSTIALGDPLEVCVAIFR